VKFRPLTWLLIGFVQAWRALISPLYGDVCKYYPSCSAYGLEALRVHGAFRGSAMTVWRVLRCNPWSDGGFDPVAGSMLEHEYEQMLRDEQTCSTTSVGETMHQSRGEQ